MILLIDNYDSFVHNLARYFERLGQGTLVVRNDAITPSAIERLQPDAIVISPGPCSPAEAGCSVDVIKTYCQEIPTLGVCLGHQAIGAAFGGQIVRAKEPMHGRASAIHHREDSVFEGVPNPMIACRYHSLVVESSTLPTELNEIAWTEDGTIMALAHREYPVVGVQFHPESILTDAGYTLLANFLNLANLALPQDAPSIQSERVELLPQEPVLPTTPVTF